MAKRMHPSSAFGMGRKDWEKGADLYAKKMKILAERLGNLHK